MKLKHYLSGFGAGVLFATIILSISFAINLDAVKNAKTSDEQVEEMARELGMVYAEEISDTDTKGQPSDMPPETTQPLLEETTSEQETESETETETEAETSISIDSTEQTSTESETETTSLEAQSEASANTVFIEVVAGMGSETVSHLLQETGVIADENDFNRYIVEKGYEKKIRTGHYEFKIGSSYDEIFDKLCN